MKFLMLHVNKAFDLNLVFLPQNLNFLVLELISLSFEFLRFQKIFAFFVLLLISLSFEILTFQKNFAEFSAMLFWLFTFIKHRLCFYFRKQTQAKINQKWIKCKSK